MFTRILAAFCLFSSAALADNVMHPSTPVLDRPTLMSLGVQLPFTGDDNRNATVTVRYRSATDTAWRPALNLYRVRTDTIFAYTVVQQFAGSVLDLRPATAYTIELHAVDPDGGVDQTFTLIATTRSIPADPATPRAVAVGTAAQFRAALSAANAGDIITLAPGTYTGQFGISRSGSAANPIVIRGASQAGVILDGQGCTGCNILEVYGSFVHIEDLTLRNAERAIRFQVAASQNNVVRRVHIKDTRLGIGGRGNQLDFYIADNILEGRLAWPRIYTDDNGAHSDDDGIAVLGFGHVVAHNRISGYGDAIKTSQHGARALDFYGNDVLWSYDNGLELDESEGNARALRNRFTNCSTPLSVQPVYAGPAYILRNVVTNTVDEQVKFHALNVASPPPQPNGVMVFNNTFVSSRTLLQVQTPFGSYHSVLENNLFLGPTPLPGRAVNWDAPLHNALFDYNGYYPDGRFFFRWDTGVGNYPDFATMKAAGVEPHGLLVNAQTFANGFQAPTNYRTLLPPPDLTLSSTALALDRGVVLPNISDAFNGAAPDLGALELGCPIPIYGPRTEGIDESNEPLGCGSSPTTPPPASGTATFLRTDTTTRGNWKGLYGADGAIVVGDGASLPPYATVTPAGNNTFTWLNSTTDTRALLKRGSATERVVAAWYNAGAFTVTLNLSGGQPHQFALYALDWDGFGGGRAEKVEVLDSAGTVLDTRTLNAFQGGQYLVWNMSGKVTLRVTNTNPAANAVVFGLFFGAGTTAPPQASGTATFLRNDAATKGNWKSVYGAEGAIVVGDSSSVPSYVTVTPAANSSFTWANSTAEPRGLLKRASATDRIAACWHSVSAFTVALNFTDSQTHQFALYALDWDNFGGGRTQRVEVLDTSGAVLDTRTLSNFQGGQYLVWNMSGRVTLRITNTNPAANAVVAGLFFGGGATPPGSTATFVRTDTTTQGNWKSQYGGQGAIVVGDSATLPPYLTVTPAANNIWVWDAATTDARALLKSGSAPGRIAACWYNYGTFTVALNFTDGQLHQVALYALDWDNHYGGRAQKIEVLDTSGNVLDTRTLADFQTGTYLVWNMSGKVTLRLTSITPSNAVIGGLFFQ